MESIEDQKARKTNERVFLFWVSATGIVPFVLIVVGIVLDFLNRD